MIALPRLEAIVDRALEEDLAGGDLTTEAMVSPDARAIGRAIARMPMVACGADVFARVFTRLDPGARVERLKADGETAAPDEVLWIVEGQAHAILMGERVALNFVQRLSGIATLTREYVTAIPPGCSTRITDTRKTTPGLRALERYAVRSGGGRNHRDALGAGVLIKDNHIAMAGGVRQAIEAARAHVPHTCRIEIEVESMAELDEALGARADIVMLDNFAVEQVGEAVRRVGGRAIVEVSGGVGVERIAELGRLGVDVISVGAITHSAGAVDISLEIEGIG
ncbi:MAG: carboxylating nicotinate-nucleotide diphosphorylase [Polyangiaceae bacterium]|nr:carboxylating nicotinate-nucleotide diphosphorylase [Polyangiaceae bacterium]